MSFTRNQKSPEDILDKDLLGCEPALEFLSLVREDLLSAGSHSTGETNHDTTTIIQSENSQQQKLQQPPARYSSYRRSTRVLALTNGNRAYVAKTSV